VQESGTLIPDAAAKVSVGIRQQSATTPGSRCDGKFGEERGLFGDRVPTLVMTLGGGALAHSDRSKGWPIRWLRRSNCAVGRLQMRADIATVGLRPARNAVPEQVAVSADERRRSRGETYPQPSSKLLVIRSMPRSNAPSAAQLSKR
jgi:hypothetical protein